MKKVNLLMTSVLIAMAASATNTYIKVTTAPTDWTGTYLIVCESQNVIFNGDANEANLDAEGGPAVLTNITFTNPLVGTAAIDSAVFTIAATDDTSWPWSIQSHSGFFIGHKDTVDNGLSVETGVKKKCKHTLSIDNNGNFIAVPRYENCGEYNLQYAHKATNMRFRYYVPEDKKSIQLYKLVTDPTALSQLTDSPTPQVTKVIQDGRMVIIRNGQTYTAIGSCL